MNALALHPAIVECRRLYDLERDNTPLEQAFMSSVGAIVTRTRESRRHAENLFGMHSSAYAASRDLALRQEGYDLTAALESYQRHLEPCP